MALRALSLCIFCLCLSVPSQCQTKFALEASASKAVKNGKNKTQKTGHPVYFKARPIMVNGYTKINYSNHGIYEGYLLIKSENADNGSEKIKKEVNAWMVNAGFCKSETSYFISDPYRSMVLDSVEYRVESEKKFDELAKNMEFFNDRDEGEITGNLVQIVFVFRIVKQYWENGYAVLKFMIHTHPIGLFKMNGKDAYWWKVDTSKVTQLFLNKINQSESEIKFFNEVDYLNWKTSLQTE